MDQLMVCVGGFECLAKITLDTYIHIALTIPAGFLSRHGYLLSIHVFVGHTQHGLRLGTTDGRRSDIKIGSEPDFCAKFGLPPYCYMYPVW
jgi:hypothetical protein